ncbi:2'-5' RNA ligase family protein [Tamlana sp. I1]|uniref:2'-5' RNA ligase family protein n=1 Tax=Tamlana sp. I1 TaxID=2762061 RepID=UPI00188FA2F8|nr:mutarotase [Tamlana sp. I1]
MNLEAHYNKLYKASKSQILADAYEIDPLIDSKTDNRFGITLLIRPSEAVKKNIQKCIDELKHREPNQYYYPNSDIHITIMSIISCYNGFNLSKIDLSKYIEIIQNCLTNTKEVRIQFKGLTASNSCIMLQGYMSDSTINDIRDRLRIAFKNSNLEQSLDKRYAIQTAHATIVRFKSVLNNKVEFLKTVETYKNFDFGTFKVENFELVYNDWYQRQKFVKKLHVFKV